jgi:hypothetical protein
MKRVKEFVFLEDEKRSFVAMTSEIKTSPYINYVEFKKECERIIENGSFPLFTEVCEEIKEDRKQGLHFHLIKNCPIDPEIPHLDLSDSVQEKYKKKKTFVGEAFLLIFSIMSDSPILGYETRNNGDMYQDVLAIEKYSNTQTQKTDGNLFFHNDRTAHMIRADYLCLLGLRASSENKIYTGYIDGRWILDQLDDETKETLRKPYFLTPFDAYSKDSNTEQIQSEEHSILYDKQSFRYYDCRTTWANVAPEKAKEALINLKNAITRADKAFINIQKNDLFTFANLKGLHSRLKVEINSEYESKNRWLLKTYNFESEENLRVFEDQYFENIPGLVQEVF